MQTAPPPSELVFRCSRCGRVQSIELGTTRAWGGRKHRRPGKRRYCKSKSSWAQLRLIVRTRAELDRLLIDQVIAPANAEFPLIEYRPS